MTHPLRAAEILRMAGVTLPTGHTVEDELLRITCAACDLDQQLSAATLEPAPAPEDLSLYCCAACHAPLVLTGHPSPAMFPIPSRHTFGDYAIQPLTPSGLRMALS